MGEKMNAETDGKTVPPPIHRPIQNPDSIKGKTPPPPPVAPQSSGKKK